MKNSTVRAILWSLAVTGGLNILLLGLELLFSHMVHKESGQALLFLFMTLLLTAGVCLYAVIPVTRRADLWACLGVTTGLHSILSGVTAFIGGKALTEEWPGYGNLAWLVTLVLSLTVWYASTFAVTAARSRRIGKSIRDDRRQVKYAKKGFHKDWQSLSPARNRLLAVLRGILAVLWMHLLTGLLFVILVEAGLAETLIGYAAFPLLWALMAAAYGLHDREHRVAYTLSAAVSNLVLFLLPTVLLTVASAPLIQHRFILHLNSVLTAPFANPEQMLAVGIFLSVWIAMAIFGAGHRRAPDFRPSQGSPIPIMPVAPPPVPSVAPAPATAPVESAEATPEEAADEITVTAPEDTPEETAATAAADTPVEAAATAAQDAPVEAAATAIQDAPVEAAATAIQDAPEEAAATAIQDAPEEAAATDAASPENGQNKSGV